MTRSSARHNRAFYVATARLRDAHALEFLGYLNEERRALNMLPMPPVNKWANGGGNASTRCRVRGHDVDCTCDLKRPRQYRPDQLVMKGGKQPPNPPPPATSVSAPPHPPRTPCRDS